MSSRRFSKFQRLAPLFPLVSLGLAPAACGRLEVPTTGARVAAETGTGPRVIIVFCQDGQGGPLLRNAGPLLSLDSGSAAFRFEFSGASASVKFVGSKLKGQTKVETPAPVKSPLSPLLDYRRLVFQEQGAVESWLLDLRFQKANLNPDDPDSVRGSVRVSKRVNADDRNGTLVVNYDDCFVAKSQVARPAGGR